MLGLPGGGFVTASSNKEIHFYDAKRVLVKKVVSAHTHVVKKIVFDAVNDRVISAGNDGWIKTWTRTGVPVGAWQAHFTGTYANGQSHDPFILALAFNPVTAEIVSGGEDRTVRIWTADGTLKQAISFPGSISSVKGMCNGDVIIGCADRCVYHGHLFITISIFLCS